MQWDKMADQPPSASPTTPPRPRGPGITTSIQMMFFDTDCAGVVHNIAYLRFVEVARTMLGAKLGYDLETMTRTQQYAVVLRTEIDYRRPARLGDDVKIDAWLDEAGRTRFWCAFELTRPADGTLLVTCRQSLAIVQMPEGRPLRLPDGFGQG